MPVDDIEVHEKVRKTNPHAGCYNRGRLVLQPGSPGVTTVGPRSLGYWAPNRVYRPDGSYTMSEAYVETSQTACRQVGQKVNGEWQDLPECVGCQAEKDVEKITEGRERI